MSASAPIPVSSAFDHLDQIASPVFVLEIGSDDVPRYVAFNQFARDISGKTLSFYLGRPATQVYPKAYGRTAYARHCEVAQTGVAMTYTLDLPLAGQTRSVRTTLIPHRDPASGRYLLFGSSQDITIEKTARETQVNFDTLSTEMEQFVALAAHDLRAPMRNMASLIDMLKEDFVDHNDGKVELLDMMEDVAGKSMRLIADVLDHARAAQVSDSLTSFNLSALCQDICDVLDPLGQHSFTYTMAQINTDRTVMQIALRNIIDNALKYGGKANLNININVQSGAKGMLDVVMRDDGQGFSEGAIRFLNGGAFQTDSGYGLLGVRRMVEARGGTISAGNGEDGTGAIIRFSVPGEWIGKTTSLGDMVEEWTADAQADQYPPSRSA